MRVFPSSTEVPRSDPKTTEPLVDPSGYIYKYVPAVSVHADRRPLRHWTVEYESISDAQQHAEKGVKSVSRIPIPILYSSDTSYVRYRCTMGLYTHVLVLYGLQAIIMYSLSLSIAILTPSLSDPKTCFCFSNPRPYGWI